MARSVSDDEHVHEELKGTQKKKNFSPSLTKTEYKSNQRLVQRFRRPSRVHPFSSARPCQRRPTFAWLFSSSQEFSPPQSMSREVSRCVSSESVASFCLLCVLLVHCLKIHKFAVRQTLSILKAVHGSLEFCADHLHEINHLVRLANLDTF